MLYSDSDYKTSWSFANFDPKMWNNIPETLRRWLRSAILTDHLKEFLLVYVLFMMTLYQLVISELCEHDKISEMKSSRTINTCNKVQVQ